MYPPRYSRTKVLRRAARRGTMRTVGAVIATIFIIGTMVGITTCAHMDRSEVEGVVTEKTVKRMGKDEGDKYLIFVTTTQGKSVVLENTDSLIEGKWNSANVYGQIKIGKSYRFKVYGWRNGCMSWYKNIVEVIPLKRRAER